MVREQQVWPATVNVEGVAQALGRHSRTLDVPARPAIAPGRLPADFSRLGGLPQGKVRRAALGLLDTHPGTGHQVFQFPLAELAVVREGIYCKIDISVVRGIGMATRNQGLDHRDDVINISSRPRLITGSQ